MAKAKKERKKREVVEIEVSFDSAGHVETKDANGKLIIGIPRKAFLENVPEKTENEKPEAKKARLDFRRAAKIASLAYARDVAQFRLDNYGKPKANSVDKAKAKLEKLKVREAELLAIINAK